MIAAVIAFVSAAVLVFAMIRNDMVCRERMRIVEVIAELADKDIDRGQPWRWRYKSYNEITYSEMFWKFWRPVSSFYRDHECLSTRGLA